MSHRAERKEKKCLNCGTEVLGRYCHKCGQENVEPKQTFWHLLTHFAYDIAHFDGKFFSTVKYLLFRPGFLSSEYVRGRRSSYLEPIKMYIFTSAFFFLFFFSLYNTADHPGIKIKETRNTYLHAKTEIERARDELAKTLADKRTPSSVIELNTKEIALLDSDLQTLKTDTNHLNDLHYYTNSAFVFWGGEKYYSIAQYDSIQKVLPKKRRDGWIEQNIRRKGIDIQSRYGNDLAAIRSALLEKLYHSFPKMLFISLPFFALLLRLLYLRRKQLYYTDHLIYTIHLYCGLFIFLFVQVSLAKIMSTYHLGWLSYVRLVIYLLMFFYIYKAMRNFYMQGRLKTILKFTVLLFASAVLMLILLISLVAFSAFTI